MSMDLMPMSMLKMVTLLKKFKKMIKNIYKKRINRTQFVMYSLILVLIIEEITLLWNSSFEDIVWVLINSHEFKLIN